MRASIIEASSIRALLYLLTFRYLAFMASTACQLQLCTLQLGKAFGTDDSSPLAWSPSLICGGGGPPSESGCLHHSPRSGSTSPEQQVWLGFVQEQHAQANYCLVYGRGRCPICKYSAGNWSWIRVGNKLQKPAPLVDTNLEKKKGGLRKVMKKVKNAFVKGVKALV